MTTDSVFNIASMTKAITGTAAMQLVEQGKLALDVPISTYIPRAADFQVLDGFDDNGKPKLRAAKRPITLRHLMTHTSGLVYNTWDADFDRFVKVRNFPLLASGKEEALYPPLDASIPANGGNTASRSTGSAVSWRRSAPRASAPTCRRTSSARST